MKERNKSRNKKNSHRVSKGLIFAAITVVLLGLIVVGVWTYRVNSNEFQVSLSLYGEKEMILEYGATYDEPGAAATGYGTHLKKEHQTLEVTTSGEVCADKLGTYQLVYSAEFEGVQETLIRTVTIVDTVAPEIALTSDPEHFTFPNQPYAEEGYSAVDNYDGDLTDQVTVVEQDGKVIYTVSDSSGNETSVERQIRYDDPVPPELTLKGNAKITITEGSKWIEPGYLASDNVDGDLTEQVTVNGKVDYNKVGTYKLTYEVKDGYGNTVTAERTITVKAKPQPAPSNPSTGNSGTTNQETVTGNQGKVIYLTFDDGPSKYTPRLLEILAKHNVKATFFVCGTGKVDLLDDIAKAGHTLALHSKTHKYNSIYASEDAFYDDLYAIQSIVEKYSGVKSFITRFPGGSSNGVSKKICPGIMTKLTQSIQEKGFTYFDWNIDSKDAGGAKTTDEVAQNVINGISKSKRKHLVVLQHDIKGYSVEAVEQIIQWGLANGCTFQALTQSSPVCHHSVNN